MNFDQYTSPSLSFKNNNFEYSEGIAALNFAMPDHFGLFTHLMPVLFPNLPSTLYPCLISFRPSPDNFLVIGGMKILGKNSSEPFAISVEAETLAELQSLIPEGELVSLICVHNRLYLPAEFPQSQDSLILALVPQQ